MNRSDRELAQAQAAVIGRHKPVPQRPHGKRLSFLWPGPFLWHFVCVRSVRLAADSLVFNRFGASQTNEGW
jgi:hypothetical protein